MENSTKTINDLKEVNNQHKAEIASLSKKIRAAQEDRKTVTERAAKTISNLQQLNKELEAEADLVFSDYEGLQRQREEEKEKAKKTINDLHEMKDQLLMEIDSKEAETEQHRSKTDDMEQSIHLLKGELEGLGTKPSPN
ncbi:tropomyosin-like [Macrobrachium rosenbergii]|uniref:tropomyosin-like n=1 Tax=Macrobrachium rosenbergii TaxID=79674 RepID=UPI0034D4F81E